MTFGRLPLTSGRFPRFLHRFIMAIKRFLGAALARAEVEMLGERVWLQVGQKWSNRNINTCRLFLLVGSFVLKL